MSRNLPAPLNVTDFAYTFAALAEANIEEIDLKSLEDLAGFASSGEEFFYGVQATVELKDLVLDYYARITPDASEEENPDDGYETKRWADDNPQDDRP